MTKLRIWTDPDGCANCNHCGMDMDCEPYCAHPTVTKEHPYGLVIDTAIARFCGKGETLTLWEKRVPR